MSRIPIKYKLINVKLKGGVYTSSFNVDIRYRIQGGAWTASHSNVPVSANGELQQEVIFTNLQEKTIYEIEVKSLVPNGNVYVDSFTTYDNMTVGESPVYLKKIYRGQQFTWYFNPPPNGTDPNLDTAEEVALDISIPPGRVDPDWFYSFFATSAEINQSWGSFVLADSEAAGPLYVNRVNANNPFVAATGKYFNGLNYLTNSREQGKEGGWLSAGEIFNDFSGNKPACFISMNFYIDPVNSNVVIMKIGTASESTSFNVIWDDVAKNLIINNRGTTFTITDTLSLSGNIEYSKWYTLRLNFRSAPSEATATPGQRTVIGVFAYLYTIDDSDNLAKCVGKAQDATMDLTWANAVQEVGDPSSPGYISEPISFGKTDKTSFGFVLAKVYRSTDLPLDVFDTVGSLASSNDTQVLDVANEVTIKRNYLNFLKILNFHKSSLSLVFTDSQVVGGGITPFPQFSAINLGSPYYSGSFPKADFSVPGAGGEALHINVSVSYTVTTDFATQQELNDEAYLQATYARYRYVGDTVPSEPLPTTFENIDINGGTIQFKFNCSAVGTCGFEGRAAIALVLNDGFLSKSLKIQFGQMIFEPTDTVGGSPKGSVVTNFDTHLGTVNGSLVITGSNAGARNTELANLNDTTGDTAQINLASMGGSVLVTKHKLNEKWISSIKAGSFTCTIPPAPNKYEYLPADPNTSYDDEIQAIITSESETIPKGNFSMGIELQGLSTSDDPSIVVGFPRFIHPTTASVEVLDVEDWLHDSFEIDFANPTTGTYESEKDKFYNFNDTLHTQWGGYNGGVSGELFYFDETDPSIIFESHGDLYPLDGEVKGVEKGPKDYNFQGYGAFSKLFEGIPVEDDPDTPNVDETYNPITDPNYYLSADKFKRRRVGSVLITKKYCSYGSFLVRMKLPKGIIGISPALWFFHYIESYPSDPRWDWWIRRGTNTYSTNYLVVNNEIDMELPSHITMYQFGSINEVATGYWDPLALDDQYKIGVYADSNPDNNGTWRLKAGSWIDPDDGIQTEVSDPYLVSSWVQHTKYLQERLNPDMSNVKFNNWIGQDSGGFGWAGTKEAYTGRTATGDVPVDGNGVRIYSGEEYLALMTELKHDYADDEYHDWEIKWFPDRTELWVDGVYIRSNKAFVPFNVMKYTYGLWFPSNKYPKLESGELSWETDRGSWGGRQANYEVAHMRINKIAYRKFTPAEIADGDGRGIDGGDPNKLRYFSESYPEAGLRVLSKN